MEYRDFNTGVRITREQYIEIGLSRGELVGKEECGCVIIQDRTADAYIVYCDKHDAAEGLYEALKAFLVIEYPPDISDWLGEPFLEAHELAQQAIAKTEKG